MSRKPKKGPREKDLTSRYKAGDLDADRVDAGERFKTRNKTLQQDKTLRTAQLRSEGQSGIDIDALPEGEVVQVHSLFCHVQHEGKAYRCVVRRTLIKVSDTYVVVGDRVRFRIVTSPGDVGKMGRDPDAPPDGVVEQILPRKTILTRADSFKGTLQHPIVANAQQMLIVASILQPRVKWGLVDRMIVAALGGGLLPIICLNKVDLVVAPASPTDASRADESVDADAALAHYASMGVPSVRTSVELNVGLDMLRDTLRDKATVLAGHSGVGKSSLIRAIQPAIDIRVGEVSRYTDKGRHTTTSAKRYALDFGGAVIDTPGVKMFGLWGVTQDNLKEHFPDVAAGTAPQWRKESFERITESLPDETAAYGNT